ncbi:MAG: GAF domain-containing sensor histidine kinase [Verrucomicrobia bacterium]|nr:GAF domain-containing sensor histidine kinase [Verrucomicrobiota bacterium]
MDSSASEIGGLRARLQRYRRLVEEQAVILENCAGRQHALTALRQRALQSRDMTGLLSDAVSKVLGLLNVPFCAVLELQEDERSLLLRGGAGWRKGVVGHATVTAGRESYEGLTLVSAGPVTLRHLTDEGCFPGSTLLSGHGIVSGIAVVIWGRGKSYGVLGAYTQTSRDFTDDDRFFIQSVADTIAAASERAALEQELLLISNRERQRIGQDLHDGLCQQLAGIEFRHAVLVQELAGNPHLRAEALELGKLLRDAMQQARMLAHGWLPVQPGPQGLMAALKTLAVASEKLFNVTCRWECPRPVYLADAKVATHLYRIAQEAISNAVKHGRAKRISVALEQSGPDVTLTIMDDGCGMAGERPAVRGMGLRIMDYRAEMVGAAIRIGPAPGQGTCVSCTFRADSTAAAAGPAGTPE